MTDLQLHIDYLLLSHDCVIVPGVGAVLAHTVPACIDPEAGVIYPPRRRFAFNAGLTQSEGLLAWSVARSKRISLDAAAMAVASAAEAMRSELSIGAEVSLGHAGSIRADASGRIIFTEAKGAGECLSPSSLWLPTLPAKPIKDVIKQNAQQRKAPSVWHRVWRSAAVAAAIVGLIAIGAFIALPTYLSDAQFASLGFSSGQAVELTAKPAPAPSATATPVKLVLAAAEDASEQVDLDEYLQWRQANRMAAHAPRRYCLIVASLASEAEANSFIARNQELTQDQNLEFGILNKDGRVRVYAATGASAADLQPLAQSLADRYPDAWVCRR